MMRAMRHAGGGAALGLTAFVLGACSSPSTTLLTLDAMAPPQQAIHADYRGPAIVVPAVHVPAILDRAEFVHQVSAGAAKVDDFARWAAPLGILTRDVLVRDLAARLPEGSVLPPGTAGSKAAITIDVTILSFDATAGGATMQAAYRITPQGAVRQISLDTGQAARDPVSAAQAYTKLIGQLADTIGSAVAGNR